MIKQNSRAINLTKILIGCFFIVAVIMPVATMFINMKPDDVVKIFTNEASKNATIRSLAVSATSTVISVFLAFVVAWCMNRTAVKFKSAFNLESL